MRLINPPTLKFDLSYYIRNITEILNINIIVVHTYTHDYNNIINLMLLLRILLYPPNWNGVVKPIYRRRCTLKWFSPHRTACFPIFFSMRFGRNEKPPPGGIAYTHAYLEFIPILHYVRIFSTPKTFRSISIINLTVIVVVVVLIWCAGCEISKVHPPRCPSADHIVYITHVYINIFYCLYVKTDRIFSKKKKKI